MTLVGQVYRPPSEAESILIQITEGCSHNKCTYCGMYRGKQFRVKSLVEIEQELLDHARFGPLQRRLFLCDGDALVLSSRRLLPVLDAIRRTLPWIERVGIYGDTRGVLNKTVDQLIQLKEAGLGIVYHGVESGDDETLASIQKGGTRDECIETASRLKKAGILHSVIVLLGVGGVKRSNEHAVNTASLLTEMDPPYVGALTLTVIPEAPLSVLQQNGEFELPEKRQLLKELRTIVAKSNFSNCRFSSNHASNYLPIRSDLPGDKEQVLNIIDTVLASGGEEQLKPEWMRGL
ncbi:MAG: radical SAM protein [Arenicellales bacterium]|nr:radical SAM protein [Arenicellales bacterium]MDP6673170.1 radical SAM protein [Arenicellales bacterium]MDP6724741.1 radical SAM protein [Arenicellales bacterium]